MDFTIRIFVSAGKKEEPDWPIADHKRTGKVGAAALRYNASRGVGRWLRFKVFLKIVDDARLAIEQNPLKAAAGNGGNSRPQFDRARSDRAQ